MSRSRAYMPVSDDAAVCMESTSQIRVHGLIRIFGIVHHTGQTFFDRLIFEVLAQLSLSDGHPVVKTKKKPVHRRTDPSGSFPLAGVLVWLSMCWLDSRIRFAHQMELLIQHKKAGIENTWSTSFSAVFALEIRGDRPAGGLPFNCSSPHRSFAPPKTC